MTLNRTCCALTALAGFLGGPPAGADVINVPADHPTIQAAISVAAPGDTVLVADGVYTGPGNRDIDFLGKAITVRSAGGAAACTINSQGSSAQNHSAFQFTRQETAASVLDGFTITNGEAFAGGGIMVSGGSTPTIRNCVVRNNRSNCWGAGMYADSAATVVNCVFTQNVCTAEGGGVFTIQGSGNPRFIGCTISNNQAGSAGGGTCSFGGSPAFINCVISGNSSNFAGGVYCGGATISNCTIAFNSATQQGAGIYGNAATVRNSIIYFNSGPTPITGTTDISYSVVQGGAPGAGNRTANPLFTNPGSGDFSLGHGSSAIDAGNNALVPAGVTVDAIGNPRFVDDPAVANSGAGTGPLTDIGAVEHQNPACPCDWNDSGDLGSQDFFDFMASFFAGQADFNASGATDSQDFFDFLGCFFAPCA